MWLTESTAEPEFQRDALWLSLRYFALYRLLLAGVFLVSAWLYADQLRLGSFNARLFEWVSWTYLASALLLFGLVESWKRAFRTQVSAHVTTDILAIVLLMNASGGLHSGLGVMLLVSLAAAALVAGGRLTVFFAALASIALLLEQTYWVLRFDRDTALYFPAGLLSICFFVTAWITHRLARRMLSNENLARQRGIDLANQMRINQLVIQDMQDGVLVISSSGHIRQHNPRAGKLLNINNPSPGTLDICCLPLAVGIRDWQSGGRATMHLALGNERLIQARFVRAGARGTQDTVIFLEDLSKAQERAQQLKLAALGRLTMNIAHEIRNPLSAIGQAAELLPQEKRAETRARLCRIVYDNTQRLERIVQDVLQLNNRDRVHPERIELEQFLPGLVEEFVFSSRIATTGVTVEVGAGGAAWFDRGQLHQVLWNLLSNAWRHGRRQTGSVSLRARHGADSSVVDVTDDGPGIASDVVGQVFEPFFTTENSGTGLGLYIAREICQANGASLEFVGNEPGAHFRLVCRGD